MNNVKNAVQVFNFEGAAKIRTVSIGEEIWFVGKDVCRLLGYVNETDAMNRRCKGVVKRYPLQTSGGEQEIRILSEADVMRLICGSKLPAAQRFERWVFEEVLPSIRRTGKYEVAAARVLKVQVSEIIKAAEDEEGRDAFVAKAFIGGKDGSDERLEGILQWIAPRNLSEDARKMFYHVSTMEAAVPSLTRAYRSGEISDARLMEILRRAITASEDASQMWLTLQKQWERQP